MGKKIRSYLILVLLLMQTGVAVSQLQTDISKMTANVRYKTTNLTTGKYTFSLSLLGGVSLLKDRYFPYEGTSGNMSRLNLDLSGELFLSNSKAIQIDADYTSIKSENTISATGLSSNYTAISGGDVTLLSLKGSFMIGRFRPEEKFIFYGSVGFGVYFGAREPMNMIYYYPNANDTSRIIVSQSMEGTLWINPVISLGGAAGYRFSKNFGVKAEVVYNYLLGDGENYFSGKHNYFPLRAGLFYIF